MTSDDHVPRKILFLNLLTAFLWGTVGILAGFAGLFCATTLDLAMGLFGGRLLEAMGMGPESTTAPALNFLTMFAGFSLFFLLNWMAGRIRPRPQETVASTLLRARAAARTGGLISGVLYGLVAVIVGAGVANTWKYGREREEKERYLAARFVIDTVTCQRDSGGDYRIEVPVHGELAGDYTLAMLIEEEYSGDTLWREQRRLHLERGAGAQAFRLAHADLESVYCATLPEGHGGGAASLNIDVRLTDNAATEKMQRSLGSDADSHERENLYTECDCDGHGRRAPPGMYR